MKADEMLAEMNRTSERIKALVMISTGTDEQKEAIVELIELACFEVSEASMYFNKALDLIKRLPEMRG